MIQRYIPFETRWDPFGEINEMRRMMTRLLGSSDGRSAVFPPLNVYADGDEAIVAAELPGVEREQLDISITGSTFTLSGTRERTETGEDARTLRRERFDGSFRRSVELPFNIETDQVKATLRNGILQV